MTLPRTLLTALATLASAALLVAAPTAAHADTWRHTDAARDVVVEPSDGAPRPAVDPSRGDLRRITVRYGADALQVATGMPDFCGNYWALRVVTSRGDTFLFSRGIYSGEGCFESYVQSRRNSYRFTCAGLTVQRTEAGIVARVPRSCLGGAYRVRVGLQLSTNMDSESGYSTYDDVLRTGEFTRNKPRYSPWIAGDAVAS